MVVRGMSLAHSFLVAIVEKPVAFNQDLKAFVPNPAVDGEFVLRWLQANQTRLLLLATEATHGTKRIPTGDLLAIHVSLPRLAEQREIAEALADVDGLLEASNAMFAKKRAIKQATMQQLLTGKTRLAGFSEKWETTRLGRIGLPYGGLSGKRKRDFGSGTARYLTFRSVLEQIVLDSSHSSSVYIVPGETQNLVAKGDLLFNGTMQQLLSGSIRLVVPEKLKKHAAVPAPVAKQHNWQFNEAVVISVMAQHFGSEQFPLGRKRYTKLSYLLHRHEEGRAEGYLKKAAGPYNPRIRYGGPERIALEKGYIRQHKNRKYQGFVADSHVGEAEQYVNKWYGRESLELLEQFRYKNNDELELLTTVDMAAEELRSAGEEVSVENVKKVILGHREWKAKMGRRIFGDANLSRALDDSRTLFAVSGERDTA